MVENQHAHPRKSLTGAQEASLALAALMFAAAVLALNSGAKILAIVPAAAAAVLVVAVVAKFGWIVPCTMAGTIYGVINAPAIGHGGVQQVLDEFYRVIFCTLTVFVVGILLDWNACAHRDHNDADEQSANEPQPPHE